MAGGAQVTLTYANGREDAQRIQKEAGLLGFTVGLLQLDVCLPLPDALMAELHALETTHLYYFATPQIAKSVDGAWSIPLFDNFCKFYLHGFVELVRAVLPAHARTSRLTVLYPSTVFLDEPPKGFTEYCAAKAAGETACAHLAKDLRIAIYKPRLPRLQTDQNNSFLGAAGEAPLPVMLAIVRDMHPQADDSARPALAGE